MEGSTAALNTDTESALRALRQELKEWETAFFKAHNRKAGRDDIKQHPDIGEKYKQYNQLRHPPAKPTPHHATTPSRKHLHRTTSQPSLAAASPNKRLKLTHSLHPATIDPYDPPHPTFLSPITHRTSIGPTPQKDGMVLGLFDALSSSSHSVTPSKRKLPDPMQDKVHATPTKASSTQANEVAAITTGRRHHRSPLNASKQTCLNSYLTPSARRVLDSSTPMSRKSGVSKLRFDDTPAFLRRDSQRALTLAGKENAGPENELSWSPVAVRKLPMAAGKGLSALVKGLRDMEDERLDEELDTLREMEAGDDKRGEGPLPKILVEDSQRPDMPLGPDGGLESDNDSAYENEVKDRNGKPLKAWKKKGQKRTTRKVVMKPNVGKWKPEPVWQIEEKGEEGEDEAIVNETQVGEKDENVRDKLDSDVESKDDNKKVGKVIDEDQRKEGIGVRIRTKISATAHANFRALKIKNKQSKGKRGGRFGRR